MLDLPGPSLTTGLLAAHPHLTPEQYVALHTSIKVGSDAVTRLQNTTTIFCFLSPTAFL